MDRPPHETTRRDLLRTGVLALASGALLVGCSSDDSSPDVEPGVDDEGPSEREESTGAAGDVGLLNTALSLEVLIFDTYEAASVGSLIGTSAVVQAATLFQGHHAEHRDVLVTEVEAAGGEPFMTANPVVKAALVDPTLASVTVERDFVALARDLEQAAAQLYVHATTSLSTPELRSISMSIGAVASRRATILDLLGDLGNERVARFPTDNPLPSDAILSG